MEVAGRQIQVLRNIEKDLASERFSNPTRNSFKELRPIQLIGQQLKPPGLSRFTTPIVDFEHDLVPQAKATQSPTKENSEIKEEKSKISSKELSSPIKDPLSSPQGMNRRTLDRIRTKSSQQLSEFAAPEMLIPTQIENYPLTERGPNMSPVGKKQSRFSFEKIATEKTGRDRLPSLNGSRTSILNVAKEESIPPATVAEHSKVSKQTTNRDKPSEAELMKVSQFDDAKNQLKSKRNNQRPYLDRLKAGSGPNPLDLQKVHELIANLKSAYVPGENYRHTNNWKHLAYCANLSVQILELLTR